MDRQEVRRSIADKGRKQMASDTGTPERGKRREAGEG